jgi:hypothetical protein
MLGKILGPFEIEIRLANGEMGAVYAAKLGSPAYGLPAGARLVVKRVHDRFLPDERAAEEFQAEGASVVAVDHPNVVRTYEAGTRWPRLRLKPEHLLVMEPVEGRSAAELLERMGPLPEPLVRHIGREIARGLAALHAEGLRHFGVRPSNVLLTDEGGVKLMDLGIARATDTSCRLALAGERVPAVAYAAPEQVCDDGYAADLRADMWSLGVTLYELATGKQPFRTSTPARMIERILDGRVARLGRVQPQATPFLSELIHCLLAPERERRLADAGYVAGILDKGETSWWWKERALARRHATHAPLRQVRPLNDTDLIGRRHEIAQLSGLLDKARAGQGQVVLLEGESGVGKSRLLHEFVSALRAQDAPLHVLRGGYSPGGEVSAAGAFSEACRDHFGDERVEDSLGSTLKETAPDLMPRMASLLLETPTPAGVTPPHLDVIRTAFLQTLRALADDRPTLVLIEDLQFAPQEGRELFLAFATAIRPSRVMLVGTATYELSAVWAREVETTAPTTRIPLAELTTVDVLHLLADALGSSRLAEDLAVAAAQSSGGNPFHLFELLRWLQDRELLVLDEEGGWQFTGNPYDFGAPKTVSGLVGARVDELDADDRHLLEAAACSGFEFAPDRVAESIDAPTLSVLRRLAHIERSHGLIRSEGATCRFEHHRVLETLYERLRARLRDHASGEAPIPWIAELLRHRRLAPALTPAAQQQD